MFNNISEHQVVQGVEIITNMIAEKVCSVATTYIKKLDVDLLQFAAVNSCSRK